MAHPFRLPPQALAQVASFMGDIAVVMSYFKFQIDPKVMNAASYARLRRQMTVEIEAKQKALRKL